MIARPPTSNEARFSLWGRLDFVPTAAGGIRITNGWDRDHLMMVPIPQLVGVQGAPADGRICLHVDIADQTQRAFQAIEDAGLLDRILSFDGSYCPRLIRGGHSLSNHAFGAAIDLNAHWNPLGAAPAARGQVGSLYEVVPIFERFGFFWGGNYYIRIDGMHFEAVYKGKGGTQ